MILVLVGPSGSGKTKFEKMCEKAGFNRVVSYTTLARRVRDNPKAYYHVSKEEFNTMVDQNRFVEVINYCGNDYGAVMEDFVEPCVITVAPEGLTQLKNSFGGKIFSVFLSVPEEVRLERCITRGDTKDYALDRIEKDKSIFEGVEDKVTFVFNNDKEKDLDRLLMWVKDICM